VTSLSIAAARTYLARGWSPTPVEWRTKEPLLREWPRRRLQPADLELFADRNVGLVLGAVGGDLVDVDCDWPEASALAEELLPSTGRVHGRPSSPSSHWWYCSASARTEVFQVRTTSPRRKRVVVELRADGCMTLAPPSAHPTGEVLAWERRAEPGHVGATTLRESVARLACAAVLVANGWRPSDATALVRSGDVRAVAEAARGLEPSAPIAAWLGFGQAPAHSRPRNGGHLVAGRASPFSEAVLRGAGGVVGAAALLGLDLREGRQACPFHGGESLRSLQITGHAWRCWAGCGQGNAIHLVARALGLGYCEARTWLGARLGLDWRSHRGLPLR
jgi:hypothetical protein